MNIAVIGKSQLNKPLMEQLASQGFTPVLLEDIDIIKGIQGQKAAFRIYTGTGSVEAGYVIVTQEGEGVIPTGGIPSLSLLKFGEDLPLRDRGRTMVVLLDYPEESPGFMTRIALEKAVALARQKMKVIFLARFVRTAGTNLERLYQEARNAGVVFMKYRDLSMEGPSHEGNYAILVTDEYETVRIEHPILLLADRIIPGTKLEKAARVLRLRRDERGFIGGDNPYLHPTATNRRGVYAIANACGQLLLDGILPLMDLTIAHIKEEMKADPNQLYAEVDGEKCALCYTCYRVCPHAAMTPDMERSEPVMGNLREACYGCGICASLCPAKAIELKDHSREGSRQQGRLKMFCCENSAEIAIQKVRDALGDDSGQMEIVPASCGGEMDVAEIISALWAYERVLVAVCVDEACKHFDGNKRAFHQVLKARELLKGAGLDEQRIQYLQLSHAMSFVMADTVRELMAE
ncbi:MAG: hydrogenase iron-sulfur subunit [Clostridia bacterium]|jgi:quinone-modifying oxidoreductase subunit QmoB